MIIVEVYHKVKFGFHKYICDDIEIIIYLAVLLSNSQCQLCDNTVYGYVSIGPNSLVCPMFYLKKFLLLVYYFCIAWRGSLALFSLVL